MTPDTSTRYGTVSRAFHWIMVLLIAWQFLGMILRLILGRSPVVGFFVGTHANTGAVILLLAGLRVIWALIHRGQRPAHGAGVLGYAAGAGHLVLYALMILVPVSGLVMVANGPYGLTLFGVQITPPAPELAAGGIKPPHGFMAWVFGVLILGHIGMVMVHEHLWRDGTLRKMLGRGA